jgi:hypothetical protein
MARFQITCTKQDGGTIIAQATSDAELTWVLRALHANGTETDLPATTSSYSNGMASATFGPPLPPATSYRVKATDDTNVSQDQPVPFGTCT